CTARTGAGVRHSSPDSRRAACTTRGSRGMPPSECAGRSALSASCPGRGRWSLYRETGECPSRGVKPPGAERCLKKLSLPRLDDPGHASGAQLVLPPADPRKSAPMPFDPVLLAAGAGVGWRSLIRSMFGWKRYPGSVEAICRAALEDCWRGDFFAGSAGHFRQFWTRDLAMCTPALCRLGMRDRVVRSWAWGLDRFEKAGRITTT